MRVARIRQRERATEVKVRQHNRAGILTLHRITIRTGTILENARIRTERNEPALQVVVEIQNRRSPELAAKLHRVSSVNPREVIENLVTLARPSTRNAERTRAKIFEHTAKVEFRQTQLASSKIQSE